MIQRKGPVRRVKILFRDGRIVDSACSFSRVVISGGKVDKLHFVTDAGTLMLSGEQVLCAVEYCAPREVS